MSQLVQSTPPVSHNGWYTPLAALESRGKLAEKSPDLAGLHAARLAHLGQFFTPIEVAEFMWHLVGLDRVRAEVNPHRLWCSVFDNSYGSGRLFSPADPAKHRLYGIEIDTPLANQVREKVKAAGFQCQLEIGSMEEFRLGSRLEFAVINPAFSIPLDSPLSEPFPTNTHGRFGIKSASVSHRYAVAQALAWCRVVVALVPRTFADEVIAGFMNERLWAVYHLPGSAFESEGANVRTSILVFGDRNEPIPGNGQATITRVTNLEQRFRVAGIADFDPDKYRWGYEAPVFKRVGQDHSKPVISLPVTGSKQVRVCHDGRKIILKFQCGATQAQVMNLILGDHVSVYRPKGSGRLAKGIYCTGQGALDLENHLAEPLPAASFWKFCCKIRDAGFEVAIDPGVDRWLERKRRHLAILREPFRHVAVIADEGLGRWLANQTEIIGLVKVAFKIYDWDWGSEDRNMIQSGARLKLVSARKDGARSWEYSWGSRTGRMTDTQLKERCNFPDFIPEPNGWRTIHEGLAHAFPERFQAIEKRARQLGLDKWCSWEYQFHDLCELRLKRGNSIVGWSMGLGKARLSLALCFLGEGKRNLIVVEAHLLKEMVTEIRGLGIPSGEWQLIDKPIHLENLRKINLIAYSRLKSTIDAKHPKITYAKRLRRKIHTCICDEAHLLRNLQTDQSRAVLQLSPRVRYAMTGTPVANYPRDVLPLIQWAAGDGTANQAYGLHHPYREDTNVTYTGNAIRGVDRFRELFVTLEWVTNEFAEELREGAKREIPKIKDIDQFRAMMAPVLKRRIMEEPEVAKFITIPRAKIATTDVPWDKEHLAYYYTTAKNFIDWYKKEKEKSSKDVSLVAILAKFAAVATSCGYPQAGVMNQKPYPWLTSKQRFAIERLYEMTQEGHKTIFLANSPDLCELIHRELAEAEVDSVVFTGKSTIAQRIKALDDRFRFGTTPVLLASKGVLQTGYNIFQANRVLLYDRSWTPKIEMQAIARVLRPQQKRQVEVEYLHLDGSIDTYMAQMVEFKGEAMTAGLDFGEEDPERTFAHIETILGRFVQDMEAKMGKKVEELLPAELEVTSEQADD